MSRNNTDVRKTGNRLLDALPPAEYDRVLEKFEAVSVPVKQLLIMEDQPVEYAYFPVNCVLSILARTDGDTFVEVATIGREGMLGVPLLLGTSTTPHRACCQIAGESFRISADAFRAAAVRGGPFLSVLNRYIQILMVQFAQAGACNSRHSVEQRCARWLLMCRDRVDADEFPLTQEFLCQMLGVRRATVSEVASKFQQAGSIEYRRGHVTITNREALTMAACECYRILKDEDARPLISNPDDQYG